MQVFYAIPFKERIEYNLTWIVKRKIDVLTYLWMNRQKEGTGI